MVIPFDHLFDKDEVLNFCSNILESRTFKDFELQTEKDIDTFFQSKAVIKNIFVFFDLDEEDNKNLKKDVEKYMLYTLGTNFLKTAVITSSNALTYISKKVIKEYGKPLYGLEDRGFVSLGCDGPLVTSLSGIMKAAPSLSLFQVMKFGAGIPTLELDSTTAQLVGFKGEKAIESGLKAFTIVTKVTDYDQEKIKRLNRIEREIYCEFRGKVRLAWNDGFFNPARLSLLGLESYMTYPLAAFVDFSQADPRPFPEDNKKLETDTVRSFLRDSLILTSDQFKNKYYNKREELDKKRAIVDEFKNLINMANKDLAISWAKTPIRVALLISPKLKPIQIRRILKHYSHAKKRLDLLFGKPAKDILFAVAIQESVVQQRINLYFENKSREFADIRKATYSSKFVMDFVASHANFSLGELAHVPEEKLADYVDAAPDHVLQDSYLYTDL